MRRARELLAQIVLFGVEFGVGIVGAPVGELVGETNCAVGSISAGRTMSWARRNVVAAIILESSERNELKPDGGQDRMAKSQTGSAATGGGRINYTKV